MGYAGFGLYSLDMNPININNKEENEMIVQMVMNENKFNIKINYVEMLTLA